MKLIPDWKAIFRKAWSVKALLAAGLFSGLEFALPLIGDHLPWSRTTFAAVMFIVVALALILRILAQPEK